MPAIAIKPLPAPKKFEVSCANCNFRELCIPAGICAEDLPRLENVVFARRRIARGEALFTAGAESRSVYAVRSGFFKTSVVDGQGREQVTGFFMSGELLGLDGIGGGRHNGAAIALEDSEVCVLPYVLIEELARALPALQRQLNTILAREIVRDHGVMMLLGSMRAEERLATFLLNLSRRSAERGYSRCEFNLRMTREELGSYLGLTLETVSRLFSAFQRDGLIEVRQKHVRILEAAGLERLLGAR